MHKLSIITVNLNNRDGLQKTMDSIFAQSFTDFEWIVIDGNSTDGSRELLEANTARISAWVSEPDTGIYNAMNKGIRKAEGEYLLFLNSGDYLADPRVLRDIFVMKPDTHIVYGNLEKTSPVGSSVDRGIASDSITAFDLYTGTLNHPSCFIKRELFTTYGLYDEHLRIVSDWEFFFRVLVFHDTSVRYVDRLITVFDLGGISSKREDLILRERDAVLHKWLPPRIRSDYEYILIRNKYRKYRAVKILNDIYSFYGRMYEKLYGKLCKATENH